MSAASEASPEGTVASTRPGQKKNRVRKILLYIILIVINIAVIGAAAVNEFGNSREAAELSSVKISWWLLLPAVGCFVVAFMLDVYKYVLMLRRNTKPGTFRRGEDWRLARRTVIYGRYYDNITPAAVGGQPFQIYYMSRSGKLAPGFAPTIPVMGMISLQVGFIIVALACFIFGHEALSSNTALQFTAWFGLLFYAFWPVTVLLATFYPKITTGIIHMVIRVAAKLKLVKNHDQLLSKAQDGVENYAKSVKAILKSRGLLLQMIIISVIYTLLVSSIPFFVLTAFGGDVPYLSCLALTVAVTSAVYFVPTPGNSGAAEGTFYVVFSALSTGYVFWAMLIWRLFTYYIYIIMGPLTFLAAKIKNKSRKYKKV